MTLNADWYSGEHITTVPGFGKDYQVNGEIINGWATLYTVPLDKKIRITGAGLTVRGSAATDIIVGLYGSGLNLKYYMFRNSYQADTNSLFYSNIIPPYLGLATDLIRLYSGSAAVRVYGWVNYTEYTLNS